MKRKKSFRRMLAAAAAVIMCTAFMPLSVNAETANDTADFYVTVSDAGAPAVTRDGSVMSARTVTATDLDKDGQYSIDEILKAAHSQYSPKGAEDYVSVEGNWGLSIKTLWGDSSGSFGYWYYNGDDWASAWSLSDTVTPGSAVSAFIYADTVKWSDTFTYFTSTVKEAQPFDKVTVRLQRVDYDASYTETRNFCQDAQISVANLQTGKTYQLGTTNEYGQIDMTFSADGTWYVMATKEDKSIVPAACIVKVTGDGSEDLVNSTADTCMKVINGQVKGLKAKAAKKSIKLSWTASDLYDGYQIYYKRSGKKAGKVLVEGSANASKTLSGLAKKKYYRVKVRGYKVIGKTTFYGKYSSAKKVRTK